MNTLVRYSLNTGQTSIAGTTCGHFRRCGKRSLAQRGTPATAKNGQLTLLRAASHARIFLTPGSAQAYVVPNPDCSMRSFAWLESSVRRCCSWRTWQRCFITGWEPFSENFPRSGTMRNGIAYRLPVLVRITAGTGFSSSQMPTPRCNSGPTTTQRHMSIDGWVKLWPTPTADSATERTKRYAQGGLPLTAAVQMFPTPRANDAEKRGQIANDKRSGLPAAALHWPTPCGRDWKSGKGKTQAERGRTAGPSLPETVGGTLNPTWVEWLMGFPTGHTDLDASETP